MLSSAGMLWSGGAQHDKTDECYARSRYEEKLREGENRMNKNMLIFSVGEYDAVAKETAQDRGCFEKNDFLDDNREIAIGIQSDYKRISLDYSYDYLAIDNSEIPFSLIQKEEACSTITVLVNHKVAVTPSAQLYKGAIVGATADINSSPTVAIGFSISVGVVVNHNDGYHNDCNEVVVAKTLVPAWTKVHYGEVYYPKKTIKDLKICPENCSIEVGA